MRKLKSFSQAFGLHPVTAIGLLVVDWLLFGEEVATGGVGWVLSLPIGVLLGLVATTIQRNSYRDEKRTAIAKGFVVGLLTAIPAPLSSLGLLPLAAFGAIKLLFSGSPQETNPTPSRGIGFVAQPNYSLAPVTIIEAQSPSTTRSYSSDVR